MSDKPIEQFVMIENRLKFLKQALIDFPHSSNGAVTARIEIVLQHITTAYSIFKDANDVAWEP